jgi:hypothetical protein
MMADRIVGRGDRGCFRDFHRPLWPVLPHQDARLRGGGGALSARTGAGGRLHLCRDGDRVDAGCAQQFQHFISHSPWDHEAVVAQIGQDADRLLGGKPTSSLIIDESIFAKQGDRSVGVARQWSGRLGKVDNCQVAVFGALTDGQRHAPVDMRLY